MLLCTAKQQSDQSTSTSAKQKKLNRQNQSLPAVCPSLNWAGYTNLLCRAAGLKSPHSKHISSMVIPSMHLDQVSPLTKSNRDFGFELLIFSACDVTGEQSTTRTVRNICSYYRGGVSRWADAVVHWMAFMRPFAKLISLTGVPGRDGIGLQCLWADATRARDRRCLSCYEVTFSGWIIASLLRL